MMMNPNLNELWAGGNVITLKKCDFSEGSVFEMDEIFKKCLAIKTSHHSSMKEVAK